MDYHCFGEFLKAKRRAREIPVRLMAEILDVSPGYYCDIEKGRKYPPNREMLDTILAELLLSDEDKAIFFDLAGKARSEAPPDLPEYINQNEVVRVALRLAKDSGDSDDWNYFIDRLQKKKKDD